MPVVNNRLTIMSIAAFACFALANAADKEPQFAPRTAVSYPTRQTNDKVTVAAVPYTTEEQTHSAFGKLDPNKYGILPLLVVIQNDGNQTLRLDTMKIEYITPDRAHLDATPPGDVSHLSGLKRPRIENSPLPTGSPRVS